MLKCVHQTPAPRSGDGGPPQERQDNAVNCGNIKCVGLQTTVFVDGKDFLHI